MAASSGVAAQLAQSLAWAIRAGVRWLWLVLCCFRKFLCCLRKMLPSRQMMPRWQGVDAGTRGGSARRGGIGDYCCTDSGRSR
jgi:hypothetical protein